MHLEQRLNKALSKAQTKAAIVNQVNYQKGNADQHQLFD